MRKRRGMFMRVFKCPDCGTEFTASKTQGTGAGHIKTMYCAICRRDRDFAQVDKAFVRM